MPVRELHHHVRVYLVLGKLPRYAQLLSRVDEHLHPLHDVLVDDAPKLFHRHRVELEPVDDLHLLEESRLAALARAEEQQLDEPAELGFVLLEDLVDPAALFAPFDLLGRVVEQALEAAGTLKHLGWG